jgi:hypothetical protein
MVECNPDLSAVEQQMLSAFMADDATNDMTSPEEIPVIEQKKYLRGHLDTLNVEDRRAVANIVVTQNCRHHLKTCSEGLIVDLDRLPDNIVLYMYRLVSHILSKETT